MHGNPITFLALGLSCFSCLSIIVYPVALYMSGFIFDAPDSMSNPINWLGLIALLSYPATTVLGTMYSMVAHNNTQTIKALMGTVISYSNFIVLWLIIEFS